MRARVEGHATVNLSCCRSRSRETVNRQQSGGVAASSARCSPLAAGPRFPSLSGVRASSCSKASVTVTAVAVRDLHLQPPSSVAAAVVCSAPPLSRPLPRATTRSSYRRGRLTLARLLISTRLQSDRALDEAADSRRQTERSSQTRRQICLPLLPRTSKQAPPTQVDNASKEHYRLTQSRAIRSPSSR